MKKIFLKQLPKFIYVILAMILVLGIEAMFSIQLMKTVDLVKTNDQTVFIEACKRLMLIVIVMLPCGLILSFFKGVYRKKSVVALKKHYLKGLFDKDLKEFHGNRSGDYVSAITNDINTLEVNYVEGIYALVYGVCSFIVGVGVIAYVSPYILLGGVVFGAFMAIVSMLVSRPIRKQQEARSTMLGEYTGFVKEVLSAFHIIKVNSLEDKIKGDFYHKSKNIQDRGYGIDKMYTFVSAFQNLMGSSIMVGLVIYAIFLSVKGAVTFGGIILVVSNLEKIMRPLMEVGEWIPKITSSKALFAKLDKVLENQDVNDETLSLETFEKEIVLQNVSYAYEEKTVLENVNLSFEKGKKYLVVGPSGGGKSTLLKLLRKYLKPAHGEIVVDGKPLQDLKKQDYYKLIGNIEQHVFLFEDTIRNNLSLYKSYSDDEIVKVMKQAGLEPFLERNPNALDYMVYENGKNLSGGERSRIAIARGLLQKAQILYLDEAFSSLDPLIARSIEETVLGLEGITVVNVSHIIFEDSKKRYDKVIRVHGGTSFI